MTTLAELRQLASRLAASVADADEAVWPAGAYELANLSGRDWLVLDQVGRAFHYADGTPISGTRAWLAPSLGEPTGFVAAVTSMHVDGRFRERACRALGAIQTPVATAALTVRLLDHVPQVRAAAWAGLAPRLVAGNAEAVLDVLLAGRGRFHAPAAITAVEDALLAAQAPVELVQTMIASDRHRVRRWAFDFGHKRGLLSEEDLVRGARTDPDQFLRAVCAVWLVASDDPQVFRELLGANSVEGRLVGLTKVPDPDLSDQALGDLLTDRAPRVREQAQLRARRRGFDLAAFYRGRLRQPTPRARERGACLDALASLGSDSDLEICAIYLGDPVPRVRARAAAATAVLGRARPERAVELLTPLLLDSSARVSTSAANGLGRLGVPKPVADTAWASEQPWSRRAAWRLTRAAGGWDRVEADLRASRDDDQGLAGLGRSGVNNWVQVGAATTWQRLSEEQRGRIHDLLDGSSLSDDEKRMVAFCAGIKLSERPRPVPVDYDGRTDWVMPRRRFGVFRRK